MLNMLKCSYRAYTQRTSDLKITMGKVPRKGRESANTSTCISQLEEKESYGWQSNGEGVHYLIALNLSVI